VIVERRKIFAECSAKSRKEKKIKHEEKKKEEKEQEGVQPSF